LNGAPVAHVQPLAVRVPSIVVPAVLCTVVPVPSSRLHRATRPVMGEDKRWLMVAAIWPWVLATLQMRTSSTAPFMKPEAAPLTMRALASETGALLAEAGLRPTDRLASKFPFT